MRLFGGVGKRVCVRACEGGAGGVVAAGEGGAAERVVAAMLRPPTWRCPTAKSTVTRAGIEKA